MSNCTIFARVLRTTRCGHFNTLNWIFCWAGWVAIGGSISYFHDSDIAGFIVYMYTSYHLEIHIES